jgi:predicted phage terminase large subunit-like protein
LRGPQHDAAWADEPAKWKYPLEAWDNLELGLRLGDHPRIVATTTPRPIKLIRDLLKDRMTVVTRGSTYDNMANLAPSFFDRMVMKYENTRLGRQELYAELLEDVPGALWQRQTIDQHRVTRAPDLVRIIVGIDPAMTSGEDANETGIIVVGKGRDRQAYVLDDLSCRLSPDGWARRAVSAYRRYRADRIVAEVNNGGDLVERVLRTVDPSVAYRAVRASRGKVVRAEPIAALYEQGRVHHVGLFAGLEDQLCVFAPDQYDGSPDRVDALVWCLSELMLTPIVRIGSV